MSRDERQATSVRQTALTADAAAAAADAYGLLPDAAAAAPAADAGEVVPDDTAPDDPDTTLPEDR